MRIFQVGPSRLFLQNRSLCHSRNVRDAQRIRPFSAFPVLDEVGQELHDLATDTYGGWVMQELELGTWLGQTHLDRRAQASLRSPGHGNDLVGKQQRLIK